MAVLPAIPPVPDADRYYTTTLAVATAVVGVPFPVYGDYEDLTVKLNGSVLPPTAWGFSSNSGNDPDSIPLPITDGLVTFYPPTVGVVEIIGNWQPRQPVMATAPGIGRREFNQFVGTIVSWARETARTLRGVFASGLPFNAAGPLANRPAATAVAPNYVYLQTDDAQNRVIYYISDGTAWTQLNATGPSGNPGTNGTNGVNGGTSFKNLIVNGNFRINQRGYTSGSVLTTGKYGHDRWCATGGSATYSFVQGPADTGITITSGKLRQIVEGANITGSIYVLSWTGSAQASIGGEAAGASPLVITDAVPGNNLSVDFTPGTLSLVQLEAGTTPTPFERRPVAVEQQICSRYFQWLPVNVTANFYGGAGQFAQQLTFPCVMARAPTIGAVAPDPHFTNTSDFINTYTFNYVSPYGASIVLTPTDSVAGAYLLGYRAPAEADF